MKEMLKQLGLGSASELFAVIPEEAMLHEPAIPEPMDEKDLMMHIYRVAKKNLYAGKVPSFLGAGVYNHFIPAAVEEIVSRSEFYTSYTSYQPEISQGMLQTLFEYQSFMVELTGMDVVNASMYDWASALGEAALMSARATKRRRVLIPENILPERRMVLETYCTGPGIEIDTYSFDRETGEIDLESIRKKSGDDLAGIYVEIPNLFGVIDSRISNIKPILGDTPLLIVGANPLLLSVIRPPAEMGADIVIGEGQMLGSHMNFGGPLLGIFGTKKKYIRTMPGRIIGATVDSNGNRAFTMTLQTREQHIRRSRATSNICSNEALSALTSAVYIAVMGGAGLRALAIENLERAERLASMLDELPEIDSPLFSAPHFNEFVIDLPMAAREVNRLLLEKGIIGGLPLDFLGDDMKNRMVINTTEMHTDADYASLVSAIKEVV